MQDSAGKVTEAEVVNSKATITPDPNAKTIDVPPKSDVPTPTGYQKKLMQQWYETGHGGPAPFMLSKSNELIWMNRKERKAREAVARRRK